MKSVVLSKNQPVPILFIWVKQEECFYISAEVALGADCWNMLENDAQNGEAVIPSQ